MFRVLVSAIYSRSSNIAAVLELGADIITRHEFQQLVEMAVGAGSRYACSCLSFYIILELYDLKAILSSDQCARALASALKRIKGLRSLSISQQAHGRHVSMLGWTEITKALAVQTHLHVLDLHHDGSELRSNSMHDKQLGAPASRTKPERQAAALYQLYFFDSTTQCEAAAKLI